MLQQRSKMAELKAEITEILYHYDPVRLAKLHAPKDEYAIEAGAIVSRLKDIDDLTSLRWMVYDVCKQYFSGATIPVSSDRRYRYIAEEIWEAWHEILNEAKK